MTVLADEEQALVGTIGITGMSAHGTSLACIVGVYFDRHRTVQQGFIGNHAVQLSKRPFGVGRIGFPLLQTGLFAFLAFRSFANVCQIFQSDHAGRVLFHDAFGDHVIGVLLQPSLSSTDLYQTACCGTSAFF
jgi:hypothetical protein